MNNTKAQACLFFTALLLGFLSANAQQMPWSQQGPKVPIIGIISAAGSDGEDSDSYIENSYVQWIEEEGLAKAIPIPWNLDDSRFDLILQSVNGVLITSSWADLWEGSSDTKRRGRPKTDYELTEYQETLNYVVDFIIDKKSDGVHIPLFAVGRGFESVALSLTKDVISLSSYDHEAEYGPVKVTPAAQNSVLFQGFPQYSFDLLQNNSVFYYDHEYALGASAANTYPVWKKDKWIVTAYARDTGDRDFAAAMESQKYPMFAVMFQPERTLYEANHNPRSMVPAGGIWAVKQMARNFLKEAKKNTNSFDDSDLLNTLLFDNFELSAGYDGVTAYVFNSATWNEKVGGGHQVFFKLIVLIAIIAGGYFGYKKYKQHQISKQFQQYQQEKQANPGNNYKNVEMY